MDYSKKPAMVKTEVWRKLPYGKVLGYRVTKDMGGKDRHCILYTWVERGFQIRKGLFCSHTGEYITDCI